jgi:hypothetical protein
MAIQFAHDPLERERLLRMRSRFQRAPQLVAEQKAARLPVLIQGWLPTSPNSVGGVGFHLVLLNTSDAIIKYFDLTVTGINAVGDVVVGQTTGLTGHRLRITGPIAPMAADQGSWDVVLYNSSVKCIQIETAIVTFMDGSEEWFSRAGVRPISDLFGRGEYSTCAEVLDIQSLLNPRAEP